MTKCTDDCFPELSEPFGVVGSNPVSTTRRVKIAKYIHSCLLFEKDDYPLLFDPGKFSFIEGLVQPETFRAVKTVFITHDHPDHLDVEVLKKIVALSGAEVVTNSEVAAKLKEVNVSTQVFDEGVRSFGPFSVQAIPVPHEPVLDDHLPQMTAYLIDGRVLNPADSFTPELLAYKVVELLILPVMAPFLTELVVANFAKKMAPKQILPVHDGYAKPFFLKQRYETYGPYFEKLGIQFHYLTEPGQAVWL